MPSRKRAKGEERKAKAAAAQLVPTSQISVGGCEGQRWWKEWARWGEQKEGVQCTHGCAIMLDVSKFMDSIEKGLKGATIQGGGDLASWLQFAFTNHLEVLSNKDLVKMATDILLSLGTNIIMSGDNPALPKAVALMIVGCEHFGPSWSADNCPTMAVRNASTFRTVRDGEERDTLHFYSKRISCSCLSEKYKEAKKSQSKVGRCSHYNHAARFGCTGVHRWLGRCSRARACFVATTHIDENSRGYYGGCLHQ